MAHLEGLYHNYSLRYVFFWNFQQSEQRPVCNRPKRLEQIQPDSVKTNTQTDKTYAINHDNEIRKWYHDIIRIKQMSSMVFTFYITLTSLAPTLTAFVTFLFLAMI